MMISDERYAELCRLANELGRMINNAVFIVECLAESGKIEIVQPNSHDFCTCEPSDRNPDNNYGACLTCDLLIR